ncbi:MAG: hypothetical protein LBR31_05415 [Desulfovibrio sp.]|jgi:hypothetical protein|nr:hypothetical protein [Desulfovibrio sp.]
MLDPVADDGLNRLDKAQTANLGKIINRVCAADIPAVPMELAVADSQAVVVAQTVLTPGKVNVVASIRTYEVK